MSRAFAGVSPLQGLTVWQASKIAPYDMQISYARHLARRAREEGLGRVRVFVHTGVSSTVAHRP